MTLKSPWVRPLTGDPFALVTTTSTNTRLTVICRIVGASFGAVDCVAGMVFAGVWASAEDAMSVVSKSVLAFKIRFVFMVQNFTPTRRSLAGIAR